MSSSTPAKKKPSVLQHSRTTSISHQVTSESSFTENAPPSPQVFGLDLSFDMKKQLEEQNTILQEQSDTMKKLISEKDSDDKNVSILIETSNLISRQDMRIHKVNVEFLEGQLESVKKQLRETQLEVSREQERRHRLEAKLSEKDALVNQMLDAEKEFKAERTALQKELTIRNERIDSLSQELSKLTGEESSRTLRAERIAENIRHNLKQEELRSAKLAKENSALAEAMADLQQKLQELQKELHERELETRIKGENDDIASRIGTMVAESTRLSSCHLLDEMKSFSTQIINTPRTPSTPVRSTTSESQQIGKLISMLENSEMKLRQAGEEQQRLSKELDTSSVRVSSAEDELKQLRSKLKDIEGSEELTHKYLIDEADKIKHQKAELRVELMQQQKENIKMRARLEEMEKLVKDSPVLRSVQNELTASLTVRAQLERDSIAQTERINSLEKSLEESDDQLARCRDELEVALADKTDKEELKSQLDKLTIQLRKQSRALEEIDSQCEQYRERKIRSDKAKERALEEIVELNATMREMKRSLENQRSCEAELANLRAEKERLELKNTYLHEELQEAHSDYRAELSDMAREISESKRKEKDISQKREKDIDQSRVSQLEHDIKVHEGTIRSMKKQLDEMKQDNEKIQTQMSETARREQSAVSENGKLRQGLADAVVKIEKYKKEGEEARELTQSLAEELAVSEEKIKKLTDEIESLEDTVKEKDDLVSYLQSQVNAKQLPKVSRRSTLLSTISDSDSASVLNMSIVNPQTVAALEEEKSRLKLQLLEKRRQLDERRDMPPPSQYTRAEPSAPPRTPLSQQNSSQSTSRITTSSRDSNLASHQQLHQHRSVTLPALDNNTNHHTMRHEIPHKWKDVTGLRIFRLKCSVCFDGIPNLSKARRCTYCQVTVHGRCASKVQNTCGMPNECAQFYTEHHSAPVGRMNGWIKLFRDDVTSREWQSAWALMDETALSFYDQESAQGDLSKPFLKIDLAGESFTVRAGIDAPSKAEEVRQAASIIHVKMHSRNLYLLAPSIPSAKRWTEALQTAQLRRSALTRKASSFSDNHCLLALHAPNNLTIHSVTVVDSFLVMGAQSGLFFSPISSSRMPSRVGGIDSVTAIEVIPDVDTVAMIAGAQRSLAVVPLNSLKTQFLSSQPALQPDIISGYDHVHLLAYHEQDGNRFLIVADMTKLHILKYNSTVDMFTAYHSITTEESAMCVQSTSNGFFFGADSFYFVDMTSSSTRPSPRCLAPAHVADYPIAAMPIDNDEVLLAYQNYGMFVNKRGERTREKTVEWEQMPMEFVYTAPYLYVIHYDSIEIMQVAGNTGSKSQTILDEKRQVFTCENAHIVGRRQNGDVYISISNKEHTELHRFNSTLKPLKRKGISMATFTEKRSKVLS